jgi:hypothetical protein
MKYFKKLNGLTAKNTDDSLTNSRRKPLHACRIKWVMNRVLLLGILAFGFVFFAERAFSANWYVAPGGAGSKTGANWNNAWDASGVSWSSVSAGDTIWLAGGSYTTTLAVGKSGVAGNPIQIKRVLSTDSVPTSAAGWSAAYDSQVIFPSAVTFSSGPNYVTLDGRIEYGIKVTFGNGGVGILLLPGNSAVSSSGIVIQYVELIGPGLTTAEADAFSAWPKGMVSNLLISHCWFHNTDTLIKRQSWMNCVVQYSRLSDTTYQSGGPHPDIVYSYPCTNTIFRYNTVSNSVGDGVFYSYGYSTGEYWYGNEFINWSQYIFSLRMTSDTGGGSYGAFYIFNNTFSDYSGGAYDGAFFIGTNASSSSLIENNIFDTVAGSDQTSSGGFPGATLDYNYYVSGMTKDGGSHSLTGARPFINYSGGNLQLVAGSGPINKGVALATDGYINMDMLGNIRGADGAWDIGAFEYSSLITNGNPVISISPSALNFGSVPATVSVTNSFIVKNIGSGTLTGASSVPAPFNIVSGGSYSLGNNQTQTVVVSYSPSGAITDSQTVVFTGGGGTNASVVGQIILPTTTGLHILNP